jgi:Recombinase
MQRREPQPSAAARSSASAASSSATRSETAVSGAGGPAAGRGSSGRSAGRLGGPADQAQIEGRFLGGRPPYGYPHPNPAKAADGKRMHKLALDPEAAPVVARIFAEFIGGMGIFAIAEGLTRDGIPSSSAHDPARNTHRDGIAWAKGAVRAILTNPRYTWPRRRSPGGAARPSTDRTPGRAPTRCAVSCSAACAAGR